MFGVEWPVLLAAALTCTLAVARLARLVAEDEWPPSAWLRNTWIRALNRSAWAGLIVCPFCVAPYIAAADIAWAVLGDLHPTWWAFNGWLACSYLAAMIVARDIPADARQQT